MNHEWSIILYLTTIILFKIPLCVFMDLGLYYHILFLLGST